MSKVVHTFKVTKEEAVGLEKVYYEYEAVKSLMAEIEKGTVKPSAAKYDQLVDKFTDAHLAYQMAWNEVVGKKIPLQYANEKYNVNLSFVDLEAEITEA